jgi:ABC-type multidrug transport system fused ATPase/permease subunit
MASSVARAGNTTETPSKGMAGSMDNVDVIQRSASLSPEQEAAARVMSGIETTLDNQNPTHSSSASSTLGPSPAHGYEKEEVLPDKEFEPISKSRSSELQKMPTEEHLTQEQLRTVLSRRRTNASGISDADINAEQAEIERLMSRMFGRARHNNSEEEKTRHVGVVFKNLTVKGVGLGAALQPTIGDIFLGLPRKFSSFFTKNKGSNSGPPIRTILHDFSGVIRPGEMLLVLGRPGSGCSTFLKVLGNQRAGFKSVEGEVTYGGLSAEEIAKDYRGEVLYNPEDDLHYATLSVKRTLEFALKTRTPGKESRLEGETRSQYVAEFLKTITQLCRLFNSL